MDWHLEHPDEIPASYRQDEATLVVQAADYIAGMTDRFALATHDRLFRPVLNSTERKTRSAPGRTSKVTGVIPILTPSAWASSARRVPSMVTRLARYC